MKEKKRRKKRCEYSQFPFATLEILKKRWIMNDDGKINMRQSPLCEVREKSQKKKKNKKQKHRKNTRRNETREFEATEDCAILYTNGGDTYKYNNIACNIFFLLRQQCFPLVFCVCGRATLRVCSSRNFVFRCQLHGGTGRRGNTEKKHAEV